MKCLTVLQPWAALLLAGVKRFETRSWRSDYRGRIAIHAGRTFSEAARSLCRQEPFRAALLRAGYRQPSELPIRAVLGTIELLECVPAEEIARLLPADCPERCFGDFRPGRWAWRLANPIFLSRPCSRSGQQGLFNIPELVP